MKWFEQEHAEWAKSRDWKNILCHLPGRAVLERIGNRAEFLRSLRVLLFKSFLDILLEQFARHPVPIILSYSTFGSDLRLA